MELTRNNKTSTNISSQKQANYLLNKTLTLYIYIYIYNQNSEKIQLDFNWILNFVPSELLSVKIEESKSN